MLKGLMMDRPLSIASVIEFAADVHADTEIVSVNARGEVHRITYADSRRRIARLAHALVGMGIKPGDRVATLAFNSYRHFELYYAISGIGAVCHTINPRLFQDQLAYIVRHADDRVLFFGGVVADLVRAMKPAWPESLKYVAMEDEAATAAIEAIDGLMSYETLLAPEPEHFEWPELDEATACGLCYTSGTTGEPKGVLYSHRSSLLHAFSTIISTQRIHGIGKRILPIVPLFHVNAWGTPYTAPLTGTALVMPGPRLDGASLFDLMDREGVTGSLGVPTVWRGLIEEMKTRGRKPKALEVALIGGSATPKVMLEELERDFGILVEQGWGMTELSPVGTLGQLELSMADTPEPRRSEIKLAAGRRMWGFDMKIVDPNGTRLPHDGQAFGELCVRSAWSASGYFENAEAGARLIDGEGWLKTGDIARIDREGFMAIVDRAKDLVKSGGEWISSVDLENVALQAPGVSAAAVIGVADEKWGERPLLVVEAAKGAAIDKSTILAFMASKVAKWQVPDDVMVVDKLPMTATGKISKLQLRETVAMRGERP